MTRNIKTKQSHMGLSMVYRFQKCGLLFCLYFLGVFAQFSRSQTKVRAVFVILPKILNLYMYVILFFVRRYYRACQILKLWHWNKAPLLLYYLMIYNLEEPSYIPPIYFEPSKLAFFTITIKALKLRFGCHGKTME